MPDHSHTASISSAQADWLDRLATGASFVCLMHCLGLPLLVAALPTLSHTLGIPESFHIWVVVFAVPTSLWALLAGRARHASSAPLLLGIAGLLLLVSGVTVLHDIGLETPATVAGSLLLSAAHLANWRLRHRPENAARSANEIL